ncbi:MAG: P-loop NTPase [Anaerolineae bacterium]
MRPTDTQPKEHGPPIRVAAGLGDPERERTLLRALTEAEDLVVVKRCLAAEEILDCARQGHADVLLVAFDLHRLTETILGELSKTRVPLVVLTPYAADEPWRSLQGVVLPVEADATTVQQSLVAAVRGEARSGTQDKALSDLDAPHSNVDRDVGDATIIAVASGQGSPGRTTIAINLAAALGAVAPTALVDVDLAGPSIAAYLDADPTHNLYMLAHAEPETAREWDYALAQELQPLTPGSPYATVLCGLPKPEMRTRLSSPFFQRLVAELQRRHRYIVLDVGADFLTPDLVLHRTALGMAHNVLLVISTDLVGLWHGRAALGRLQKHVGIDPAQLALVLNRYDHRQHHTRTEIEWVLGVATAAVIPFDPKSVQRAAAAQRPVILERRSPAGRAVLDLAERAHGGQIKLLPDPQGRGHVRWLRWASALRLGWPGGSNTARIAQEGVADDELSTPVAIGEPEERSNGRARFESRGPDGR